MNPIICRLAVIAGALGIWFWSQRLIGARPVETSGIGDWAHRLTARWHRYFSDHETAANRALAVSSIFIDFMGLSLIALAVFGASFKPFIAVMMVFILRQLCQMCSTLPPPPGIIWRDPGVPTLLVTYGVSTDFFFSGHTALAVLGAIEICGAAPWWLGAAAVLIALGEAVIVLVLRAHYTLDVITGALAAWFAADMAARLAPHVDAWMK